MSEEEEKKARYLYGLKPHADHYKAHAIRTADENCQYMLPALHQKLAQNPKLKLLDVGCGPGSITVGLAKLMPEGEVVGLDLSETVLEQARQEAQKQGLTNVRFVKSDVYGLPFEDGYFDVVHTHQAVAHFHEHVRAIRELLRVTRKGGGVLCMREGDLHSVRVYPDYPLLVECWQTIIKCFESIGTDTDAGMRLKHWTVQAGVPRESVEASMGTWCYDTPEGREAYGGTWPGRVTRGALADRAVEIGAASR